MPANIKFYYPNKSFIDIQIVFQMPASLKYQCRLPSNFNQSLSFGVPSPVRVGGGTVCVGSLKDGRPGSNLKLFALIVPLTLPSAKNP